MCISRDIVPIETIIQPLHAHVLKEYVYAREMRYGFFGTALTFVCAKCQPLFCVNISCTFFIALYLLNSTPNVSIMKGCFATFSCRR